MNKTILIAALCLVLGLVIGIFIGRSMMEREWSQPAVLERLSESDVKGSTGKDADPVPKVGSLVIKKAPLARARTVLADVTSKDPVFMTIGDVGNTDNGVELHLSLKNRGACEVTSFSGTAYGYDAWGKPSKMNQGGEHFVGFSEEKVEGFGPNATHDYALLLKHVETASLALAQVDQYKCADGSGWSRPL
jgi:hypothetical protein